MLGGPVGGPLLALSGARIKQFLREPGALFWTFGFPLLITVALGTAFRNQGPSKSHVAVLAGQGNASESAASALAVDRGLEVAILDPDRAARQLGTGEVVLVIVPPASPGSPFVYRYDPTRPDAPAVRRLVDERLQRQAGRRDPLPTRDETAVARGARYVDWLVPGLLGMQLLNGAMWGAAFNIVNARQRKLLKRLAATPMRRSHYLLSFRVSGLLFVPLQVIVLFLFARLTFGVTIHGSAIATLGLALLGSWSFAGLGLLCASRAAEQRNRERPHQPDHAADDGALGGLLLVEPLPAGHPAGHSPPSHERPQRSPPQRRQRRRLDLLAGISDRRARRLGAGHVLHRCPHLPLDLS